MQRSKFFQSVKMGNTWFNGYGISITTGNSSLLRRLK